MSAVVVGVILESTADLVAGRPAAVWLHDAMRSARTLTITRVVPYAPHTTVALLDQLAQQGIEPAYVVVLDARAPLTTADDIDRAVELAIAHDLDFVVSAASLVQDLHGVGPVHGVVWENEDTRAPLPGRFVETCAFTLSRTEHLRTLPGRKTRDRAFPLPEARAATLASSAGRAACEAELLARKRTQQLQALPSRIQALVFDFDGVFTDNQVLVDQDGREAVSCSRSDAFGLAECRELAIPMIVLSTEANPVVQARCNKLKLPCIQGLADKALQLKVWLEEKGFDPANVVYVGNDINDLGCLRHVGCPVVPADAHPSVVEIAKIILAHRGGHGAVREICELVARRIRDTRS